MGPRRKAGQLLIGLFLLPLTAFGALTVTDRGTGGSNASSSSLVVTPASNLAVGSTGVLCYSGDNANAASANTLSSFTDSVGNTWTRRQTASSSTANSNVEVAIFTSYLTHAITTSDNITIALTAATVAKTWTLSEVVPASGALALYINGAAPASVTSGTPTINISTELGVAIVGMGGAESADTYVGDADTLNGSWSTKQSNGQGTGATGNSIVSQSKVTTTDASDQTFNPTLTSADTRLAYVVLFETDPKVRSIGQSAASESTTTITVTDGIASGSMAVLAFAGDNAGSGGNTANIPTSITDSKSNTWTLQRTSINDPGNASAGVETGLYTSVLSSALVAGDTVGVAYQAVNVSAKCWAIYEFPTYTTIVGSSSPGSGNASSFSSSLGTVNNGNVVIALLGMEGADGTVTADTDTTNGTWSFPALYTTGTNVTGDISLISQYKIVTATATQTWDVSWTGGSNDEAVIRLTLAPASTTPTYLHFFDFFP